MIRGEQGGATDDRFLKIAVPRPDKVTMYCRTCLRRVPFVVRVEAVAPTMQPKLAPCSATREEQGPNLTIRSTDTALRNKQVYNIWTKLTRPLVKAKPNLSDSKHKFANAWHELDFCRPHSIIG